MGDRVVDELIALFVFLKEGSLVRCGGKGKAGKGRGEKRKKNELWRN